MENDPGMDTFSTTINMQLLHAFDSSELDVHNETKSAGHSLTPFAHAVAPVAQRAAENLQSRLQSIVASDSAQGKMFGVLVVRINDEYHYLAAYSGKLDGQWHKDGYVPPPFDTGLAEKLLLHTDREIKLIDEKIKREDFVGKLLSIEKEIHTLKSQFERDHKALTDAHKRRRDARHVRRRQLVNTTTSSAASSVTSSLDNESSEDKNIRKTHRREYNQQLQLLESKVRKIEIDKNALRSQRQNLSKNAQIEYFNLFRLVGRDGNRVNLTTLLDGDLPPAGTGECAGAKLLAFALQHDLEPVAMAEFWWGQMPVGEVRHHGHYYPCCRSKCGLLIPALLAEPSQVSGARENRISKLTRINIPVDLDRDTCVSDANHIPVLFDDDQLAVVNKPEGVLSVPGKTTARSIQDWALDQWSNASCPLLVHRLDMNTSGTLLIAKDHKTYVNLQRQFTQRIVEKTYIALVAGLPDKSTGKIMLPLRVDLDDRPRQLVCNSHGKEAITDWRVLDSGNWAMSHNKPMLISRLQLKPLTGRTHQLRLHCASVDGLNLPIIGDRLYGKNHIRLCSDFRPDLPGLSAEKEGRMMLHAASLSFVHPGHQKRLTIDSAVPF